MKLNTLSLLCTTALGMAAAISSVTELHAADDNWVYQPSISQQFTVNTNPLMRTNNPQTLYGSVTTPQLKITNYTPTSSFDTTLSASQRIYNQPSFNSTDANASANYTQKMQRWGLALHANADYDTTLSSEISTLNTPERGSARHLGGSVSPELSYELSGRDKIAIAGSYLESTYDSSLYTDYHIATISPSYSYNYNQLNTFTLSAPMQRYQTDDARESKLDSITPTLGWLGNLTPTLTARATIGARHYRQDLGILPESGWKWKGTYSANITYKGQNDRVSFDNSKDLQPFANGTESFLNSFVLSNEHKFNDLFSSNVGASYRYAPKSDAYTNALRSLASANVGLTYHPLETLDIGTSYQYREQKLSNVPGDQNDNLFMLNLVYHPVLSFLDQ